MMKNEDSKQVELTTTEAENIAGTEAALNPDESETKDEAYTIDHALVELGSACGLFQMIHCLACIMMFNGSQFFYSIPFYQYYPTLICKNSDGAIIADCTHQLVCQANSQVTSHEIDWTSEFSLRNWMNELNLLCADPFWVGLIGGISFLSFSVGSIIFSRIIDKQGRKPVLLWFGMVTPVGMIILMVFKAYLNLVFIFVMIFLMGLTYNTRSSTAYLYGTEFLMKKNHLHFG